MTHETSLRTVVSRARRGDVDPPIEGCDGKPIARDTHTYIGVRGCVVRRSWGSWFDFIDGVINAWACGGDVCSVRAFRAMCVCVCVCAPVGRSVGRSVGRTDGHAHKNRDYGCVAAAPGVERPEATRVGF